MRTQAYASVCGLTPPARWRSAAHATRSAVLRRRPALRVLPAASSVVAPFLPHEVAEITEPAAVEVARRLTRVPVRVGGTVVETAHVPPFARGSGVPVLLLHGFDSSSMEFRRFLPRLHEGGIEAWALDLFGNGFTEFAAGSACTPEKRREHLLAFIEQVVQRPCLVLGASLGASAAIDLAVEHPSSVVGLVLVDGQAFESAPQLPGPLAALGVQVLRTVPLRSMANRLAYYDKERFATDDAMRVGRLHTHLPHWADANVAFMASGGYKCADKVAAVTQRTLVIWGANDEIVPPATAERFAATLRDCRVTVIDKCGHVAHLEKPDALCAAVQEFLRSL
jgi:pimeloyl-ACP methyl ester carboxylesterase